MERVKAAVAGSIGEALGLKVTDGKLTANEKVRVDELVRTRYMTDAWNLKA
jgi:lipoate-protein ligase A